MNRLAFILLLGVLALHGCGSDGGDSAATDPSTPPPAQGPPPDPNLTIPLRTAIANIVQKGFNQSFRISGSVDNSTPSNPAPPTPVTGNGQFVLGSATPTTLCNFQVSSAQQVISGTTVANGVSTPLSETGTIYYRNDNTIVATAPPGELFLHNPYSYPETIKAGEAGQIGTATQFNTDCTPRSFASTITGSYFASTDRANSLLVTTIFILDNKFSSAKTETTTVYRVNTAGDVTLVSIKTVRSFLGEIFQTLTFTF